MPSRPTVAAQGSRISATRLLALLLAIGSSRGLSAGEPAVDFSREIQPILSDRCFHCHGPDPSTRKGKLRLDRREDAFADRGGYATFVPGAPEESEAFRRVTAEAGDPDRMPPASSGKPLSAREVDLLRRWIAQGAPWQTHWAFVPPRRPTVPPALETSPTGWSRNPIDAFVLARLVTAGLGPSPEASRVTLIRRLSLDLTGLPPTPAEVADFVTDASPDAKARAIDRLLASPHLGERFGMDWLDAARYADTDGFQADATRTNWPWRDWVIDSLNANRPFDRFTIEQFAGDLIPGATPEQALATAFHRNHMTNGEGGRDPEESRIDYVIDRVNTLGTVWLGLTLGCTQCHSHKFDPISQSEYYSLHAFFNSIDEDGKAGRAATPFLSYRSPHGAAAVAAARAWRDARAAEAASAREAAEPAFRDWLTSWIGRVRDGHRSWSTFRGDVLQSVGGTILTQAEDGEIRATGPDPRHEDYRVIGRPALPRITGIRLDVLPIKDEGGGLSRAADGHFILTDISVQVRRRNGTQARIPAVSGAVADVEADPDKHSGYGKVVHVLDDDPRNGWATFGHPTDRAHTAVFAMAEPIALADDEDLVIELLHRSTEGHRNIGRFRISLTDELATAVRTVGPTPLERLAEARPATAAEIDDGLRSLLFEQFLADHAPYLPLESALRRAEARLAEVSGAEKAVEVMVLKDRGTPRDTHVLVRGVWDKKGERVEPGVPEALNPWPEGEPRNRLGLARWLTAPDQPLTARVVVNRLWQALFGDGLVRTPEDFGRQGEPPTHPELLDWLAVEFIESGWDLKHMLRLMTTSATYAQTSSATEATRARDPENRLLGRASRHRLPSWMIRDAALRAAGLLNPALGGPPVRPYQPDGVWEEMFMGRFHYEPSDGPDQYRRTVYAFWRRSAAPTFLFDSAQRRVCEVRTPRTNTPLQALTLLNDLTYLEASRALAARAIREADDDPGRLDALTGRVLGRAFLPEESAVLLRELDRARRYYRENPEAAIRWLGHGRLPRDAAIDPSELAAFAVVADLLLNIDEAITRE